MRASKGPIDSAKNAELLAVAIDKLVEKRYFDLTLWQKLLPTTPPLDAGIISAWNYLSAAHYALKAIDPSEMAELNLGSKSTLAGKFELVCKKQSNKGIFRVLADGKNPDELSEALISIIGMPHERGRKCFALET